MTTTTTTMGMGGAGGMSTMTGGTAGSMGTGGSPVVDAGQDTGTNNGPINVLVFNHTAGYGHQSRQTSIPLFQAEAAANNINFDLKYAHVMPIQPEGTNDASTPADLSAFMPGGLDKYDVIFFLNTTGHVFQDANEVAHQTALQAYMEQHHGGFVGTHSATDTYDEGWQWYQDFIGSIYSGHSGIVSGSARWKDGVTHSILTQGTVPNPWPRTEEWYVFRRDVTGIPDFTVLLLANAQGPNGAVSERPIAWVHNVPGGGRVWYCAFGHLVDAFKEPANMKMMITAIKWAAHRIN
jgi:type 1 glutamine amidotransferase